MSFPNWLLRNLALTIVLTACTGLAANQTAHAQTTVTKFVAELRPENVLTTNETSTGAYGVAQLTLTQETGSDPVLDYQIQMFNVNPTSLIKASADNLPNTSAAGDTSVGAIHVHTVDLNAPTPRGTKHVLNVFGNPIPGLNVLPARAAGLLHPTENAEDDYQAGYNPSTGATVVTGRWDPADFMANDFGGPNIILPDNVALMGQSEPLANHIDELLGLASAGNQRIFLMVHTAEFANGEFGGFVQVVPEPSTLVLVGFGTAVLVGHRRRSSQLLLSCAAHAAHPRLTRVELRQAYPGRMLNLGTPARSLTAPY